MASDKERYTEFCRGVYVPLQLQPWWLDAVCGGPDQWSVALACDGADQIAGVLPYFLTRRRGLRVIQLPPFTAYAGPWLQYPKPLSLKGNSRYSFEHRMYKQLITQLPRVALFHQTFRPEIQNWLPFYWAGFHQTTRYTALLPDTADLSALYKGLKHTVRTDLKTAARATEVVRENDPALLFRLNGASFARKRLRQPYDRETFLRLDAALVERRQSAGFIARDRQTGAPHAGLYLAFDNRQASVLLAGFDPTLGRQSRALHGVYWEAICFCSERGLSLDFEGSMDAGIGRVFRAFGAQLTPYFRVWKAGNRVLEWVLLLKARV